MEIFVGLPQQIATNSEAWDNRNVFSHSCGGHKWEIKESAGFVPPGDSEKKSVSRCSPSFRWLLARLGAPGRVHSLLRSLPPPSHGGLAWSHHAAFSSRVCQCLFPFLYKTSVVLNQSIRIGSTLVKLDFVLTKCLSLSLQRPYFQIRSHLQAL